MKKLVAHLLLAALTIVSCYGLFSCRAFRKDRSRADSTTTRYEQQSKVWESQAMQELTIETDDLAFVQPGLSLPAVLDLPADQHVSDLFNGGNQVTGKRPPGARGFTRITFRTTSKAAGTATKSSAEHKDVATTTRISKKEPPPWSWPSIALVITGVLVIAAIYSRTKRS